MAGSLIVDTSTLKSLLAYDSELGELRWKVDRFAYGDKGRKNASAGAIAGCQDKNGYWVIRVNGRNHFSHRIAWQMHYDQQPPRYIDHIDGDTSNFAISNLRAASASQNIANSRPQTLKKSMFKGVSPTNHGSWRAQIRCKGRLFCLGTYKDEADAAMAYKTKAVEFFGDFARTN